MLYDGDGSGATEKEEEAWKTIFTAPTQSMKVTTSGTSPGNRELPLHYVHEIDLPLGSRTRSEENNVRPISSVRILILEPATAWGSSLWQVRMYGEFVSSSFSAVHR